MYAFPEDIWIQIKRYRFHKHLWDDQYIKCFNKNIYHIKKLRTIYNYGPYIRQLGNFYKVVDYVSFGKGSIYFIEEIFLKTSYDEFEAEFVKIRLSKSI